MRTERDEERWIVSWDWCANTSDGIDSDVDVTTGPSKSPRPNFFGMVSSVVPALGDFSE
jgi:hypothetical protein